jgi:hypothetical protein
VSLESGTAQTGSLVVSLYKAKGRSTGIQINAERLLNCDLNLRSDFIRMLRRFTPTPLNYIVLVNLSGQGFVDLVEDAGLNDAVKNAKVVGTVDTVDGTQQTLEPVQNGTALFVFGCLANHAHAREINARMRTVVPGGSVAYISAITVAESPKALAELEMFLSYGERGKDTFTYRSALQYMLPALRVQETAWAAEYELLSRMKWKKI